MRRKHPPLPTGAHLLQGLLLNQDRLSETNQGVKIMDGG